MKKWLILILVVLMVAAAFFLYEKRDEWSNDWAELDKNGRHLTIINETNQVINEVHVTIGNGTEIKAMNKENIDQKSISIKIPKRYKKYDEFTVVIVDRYETQYKKIAKDVPKKGRTEVVITKDDVVKETNGFKKKIDRFFNGD